MLISKLDIPIQIINLAEFGVDNNNIISVLRPAYNNDYEWDYYLFRQNQIEFLKQNLSKEILQKYDDKFWMNYYDGTHKEDKLNDLIQYLSNEQQQKYADIRPTRKRLVSSFELDFIADKWQINRKPTGIFTQSDALNDENIQDYRLSQRLFKELPQHLEDDNLHKMLSSTADMLVKKLTPQPQKLDIIVHHSLLYCFDDMTSTSSPEGIHQDSADYIVSAIVIDRQDITGGKSILYGKDAKTAILELTLHEGQGILQADDKTDLWHSVTSITPSANKKSGYRATIGFDISLRVDKYHPNNCS
jgi:hypothetical protein